MPRQVLLFSGASAVGKTSVLKSLLPLLAHGGMAPCVCKIDMVSQAELEIISWQIRALNPSAALFSVDGLAGYGTDLLAQWLLARPECGSFEGDTLRHTMPSGVCSY